MSTEHRLTDFGERFPTCRHFSLQDVTAKLRQVYVEQASVEQLFKSVQETVKQKAIELQKMQARLADGQATEEDIGHFNVGEFKLISQC